MRESTVGSALRPVPTLNSYVGDLSGHHIFRVNERPYLFLTCGHWQHYHMPTDTPEQLNFPKVAAVAQYIRALVVNASGLKLSGPFEGYDTTEAELPFLKQTVQPALSRMGLDVQLRTREDIDHLVTLLVQRFGL